MARGKAIKYIVKLSAEEKQELRGMLSRGVHSARVLNRARILLWTDEGCTVDEICECLNICRQTVCEIRKRFANEGLKVALADRPKGGRPPLITGRDEAELTVIACQEAPEGRKRWTLRMIADKFVELHPDKHISHEAVRGILKKATSNRGKNNAGLSRKNEIATSL